MVMSAASSGGVSSSVAWIAAMISASGEAIAWRTSSEVSTISRGRPEARSRPRIDGLDLLRQRDRGADGELDRLGALRADRHPVLEPDVVRDRVVEVVAADAQRARDDEAAERDHGDLGRAAADVDDHAPDRLGDRRARRRSRRPATPRSGAPRARPRDSVASSTARRSTSVMPDGAQITIRGRRSG